MNTIIVTIVTMWKKIKESSTFWRTDEQKYTQKNEEELSIK